MIESLERIMGTAAKPAVEETVQAGRGVLVGLMTPMAMLILNVSMFTVAIPMIRSEFGIGEDMAAWTVTVYTLLFIISMPLYGRFGDAFGRKRLLMSGLTIFVAGTVVALLAPSLMWLMIGRGIQGIGAASATPLSMGIISQLFPDGEKGEKLGTWSSVGPVMGVIGPFLAGFLIDYFGWRALFVVIVVLAIAAVPVVRTKVPVTNGGADGRFLREFDWIGVILLSGMISSLLLYVSSRPVTGVAPLQDWRLGLLALVFTAGFIFWEWRQEKPIIDVTLFEDRKFTLASIVASIRMFLMKGLVFVIPLYLTDVFNRDATSIGSILAANAAALLITMRIGGKLADRWDGRWPVLIGGSVQTTAVVYFALLPADAGLAFIVAGLALHGLGAGLMLAALHRAAMDESADGEESATAALYSTVRFSGSTFGTALAGVVLHMTLTSAAQPVEAYKISFWFLAAFGLLGVILGMKLDH